MKQKIALLSFNDHTGNIELNKKDGETANIYTEIGEHLGTYYDNLYKCIAIFEDEERKAHDDVQKITDRFIARVDEALVIKEKDLMEI